LEGGQAWITGWGERRRLTADHQRTVWRRGRRTSSLDEAEVWVVLVEDGEEIKGVVISCVMLLGVV
jgi:hypothetical protein